MTGRDSTAGLALGLAAALGFVADRLFVAGPVGPGFAIWIALLGVAAVLVARRAGVEWVNAVAGWSAISIAAATAPMLRDVDFVILAMWLVLIASASMVILRTGGIRLGDSRPADHVLGLALVPGRAALGVLPLLRDVQPPQGSSRHRLAGVARGALIAIPLLVIFGALFSSADAGFNRYVVAVAAFWSEDLLQHLIVWLAFGWIAGGLLAGLRARRLPDPLSGVTPPRVGAEETAVVMGLLAALFLAFVGFQLGYLFGGREVIEATSGLTVAEYARRGFFELLVVGVATIGVLLVGDALTTARRLYRVLAAILVACVLVILMSAAQRLTLYTSAYGLTVDRITAAVVMAWLAVVLVLFATTVLRERPAPFSSAALVAGIVAAFALVVVNPGALAARSNLDRAAEGVHEADAGYLMRLGADAVPTLVDRMDVLPADVRCTVAGQLLERWVDGTRNGLDDWRSWNAARAAARDAVQASESELRLSAAGC